MRFSAGFLAGPGPVEAQGPPTLKCVKRSLHRTSQGWDPGCIIRHHRETIHTEA